MSFVEIVCISSDLNNQVFNQHVYEGLVDGKGTFLSLDKEKCTLIFSASESGCCTVLTEKTRFLFFVA